MVKGDAGVDRDSQASCYPPDSQEESAPLGNCSARFSAIVLDNRQEALERAVHECCVFIVPQVGPQFLGGISQYRPFHKQQISFVHLRN